MKSDERQTDLPGDFRPSLDPDCLLTVGDQATAVTLCQPHSRPTRNKGVEDIGGLQSFAFALAENGVHIKLTRKSGLSFLTPRRSGLCKPHRPAGEFAKTHFGVNFADNGAQTRVSLQQIIGFPNLGNNLPSLPGKRSIVSGTRSGQSLRLFIRLGVQDRTYGRRKHAAAALPKVASGLSIALTPANFIDVQQSNRNIDRYDVRIGKMREYFVQARESSNAYPPALELDCGPAFRRAVYAQYIHPAPPPPLRIRRCGRSKVTATPSPAPPAPPRSRGGRPAYLGRPR